MSKELNVFDIGSWKEEGYAKSKYEKAYNDSVGNDKSISSSKFSLTPLSKTLLIGASVAILGVGAWLGYEYKELEGQIKQRFEQDELINEIFSSKLIITLKYFLFFCFNKFFYLFLLFWINIFTSFFD